MREQDLAAAWAVLERWAGHPLPADSYTLAEAIDHVCRDVKAQQTAKLAGLVENEP